MKCKKCGYDEDLEIIEVLTRLSANWMFLKYCLEELFK